MLLNYYITKR